MNIEELKNQLKNSINEISVYDFNSYTSIELYYKIANKVNEIIKELERHEILVSDEIIKQNNALQEMLDVGLHDEVVNKINDMVNDGTMDLIINQNVLEDLNTQIKEKTKYVTYGQFGAKGDGIYDDGIAIKLAHDYANKNNLPVINTKGDYYILNTFNIEIKTDTNWGKSVFHIKESNKQGNVVFKVLSNNNSFDLPTSEIDSLRNKIKKGTCFIDDLSNYENYFMTVYDDNTNWTVRSDGHEVKLKDNLMIGQGGKIVGGCARDVLNPTRITAIKLDTSYLNICGGIFNIDVDYNYTGYINGIIRCFRSKTIFDNNSFNIVSQTGTSACNGFIQIENCCDVTINNPQIPSRIDTPMSGGSYGLMLSECVLINLYNFKNFAHGSNNWGVTGCNFVKNLNIRDSYLSRLDCHCGAYNIYVDNVHFSYYGITVTGGGELRVNNCEFVKNIINLRDDYGSRWDGAITLNNIIYKIVDSSIPKIIVNDNTIQNHDFVYDTMMCNSLIVNNLTFDYTEANYNNQEVNLLLFQKKNFDYKLPYEVIFRDIKVKGRESNIKLLYVDKAYEQTTFKNFEYYPNVDGVPIKDVFIEHLVTNCDITFDNISTKKITGENIYGNAHIIFNNCNGNNNYVTNGFAPRIKIKNCDNLNVKINGALCDLNIYDSTVNMVNCYSGGGRSRVTINNCRLQGNITNDTDCALRLTSDNISLNNCIFLPKFLNGVLTVNLSSYDFLSGLNLKCISHGSYLSKSFKDIENYQSINYLLNGGTNVTVYPSSTNDLGTLRNEYNNLIASLKSIGIIKN